MSTEDGPRVVIGGFLVVVSKVRRGMERGDKVGMTQS